MSVPKFGFLHKLLCQNSGSVHRLSRQNAQKMLNRFTEIKLHVCLQPVLICSYAVLFSSAFQAKKAQKKISQKTLERRDHRRTPFPVL